MRRLLILALLSALAADSVLAQGDIDNEKKILYRNEWSIGTVMKTNGLEFDYRSGKFVNAFKKNLWDCGLGFIKHPQQYRQTNPYWPGSGYGSFCFGKKNFCFDIFYSWGRQRVLFQKFDLSSVEIRMFYLGGVDLAFLKPIYYEIYKSEFEIVEEKFDPDSPYHYATVTLGTAPFTKGFNEITAVPGVHLKMGLSVEFGKTDTRLIAMEAGAKVSAYAKKLDIMSQEKNPQLLCNLFVAVRFGKVKHGAHYEYLNDYQY
ncbi:MAG: hypothetical protein MJZ66_05285 [Bacteroidales bacterium]|nr:hypothetical protein [Bacteroidales bacterium]